MVPGSNLIGVYLEIGKTRTFAGALDWPGWCRSGRDEAAAIKAGWRTFDSAVVAAKGKELRKGPRGGGRELDKIVRHLLESDAAYLARLGVRFKFAEGGDPQEELLRTRQAILQALEAAAAGESPKEGPRGGIRWTPRRFVRRVAWHVLDHAWEIEDRIP